jgi:GNAT superfamily N-acetyltransferase
MTGAADIELRTLRAGEYDVLDTVFDGLSANSRHHRYHAGLPRLTPAARDNLVAVDGRRHIAVAAFAAGRPIGIARLVDVGGGCAELAVEVVDASQGRGVGTRLLCALAAHARAVGVRRVIADVLADNLAAQVLFTNLFPTSCLLGHGSEIRLTAPLAAGNALPGAAWPSSAPATHGSAAGARCAPAAQLGSQGSGRCEPAAPLAESQGELGLMV